MALTLDYTNGFRETKENVGYNDVWYAQTTHLHFGVVRAHWHRCNHHSLVPKRPADDGGMLST